MYGILSFKAASLLRGNKLLPEKASLQIYRSSEATESTIIVAAPSRMVIFVGLQVTQLNGDFLDGIGGWSP